MAANKIGKIKLKKGAAAEKFWPVDPEKTATVVFVPEADVTPTTDGQDDFNTIVLPPKIGIFDILVEVSDDLADVTKSAYDPEADGPVFVQEISGTPTTSGMPMVVDDETRSGRFAFAVRVPDDKTFFEGTLILEAKISGSVRTLELALKVEQGKTENNLFIFWVMQRTMPGGVAYSWCKFKTVERAGGAALEGVSATIRPVRENSTFKKKNRLTEVGSNGKGFLAPSRGDRDVLGLPTKWPILIRGKKGGYVPRGHLFRTDAPAPNNLDPIAAPAARVEIPFTKISDVDLSGTKILLDPGHGVVYRRVASRRSQEWFVASLIARHAESVLRAFGLPSGNVGFTRNAGFALIDPGNVHKKVAPETGADRYVIEIDDPDARAIRTKANAVTLTELSDLVLTKHEGDADDAVAVSVAERRSFMEINTDAFRDMTRRALTKAIPLWSIEMFSWTGTTFFFRLMIPKPGGSKIQIGFGSTDWAENTRQYQTKVTLITQRPSAEQAVEAAPVRLWVTTTDVFVLNEDMLRNLEDRSARWSIACEVGASDAHDTFQDIARTAMLATGALEHMKREIAWCNKLSNGVTADGPMAWRPERRTTAFNSGNWDFIVTIHCNASKNGSAIGSSICVEKPGSNSPPAEAIRIGKTMLKYVEPLDQGLRLNGFENPGTSQETGGAHRTHYAYIETEFMDTVMSDGRMQYEALLSGETIGNVAEQIVYGILEWLFDKQDPATFNAVKIGAGYSEW
jgi:N-acetylmuramoyl-L-alanine amidase